MEERAVPKRKMAESGPTAGSSDTAETYKAFPVNNCRERAGVTCSKTCFHITRKLRKAWKNWWAGREDQSGLAEAKLCRQEREH